MATPRAAGFTPPTISVPRSMAERIWTRRSTSPRARRLRTWFRSDRLIGPGFVIDVTRQSAADADYLVTAADIEAFETEHGRLPEGAIVLLNTGRAGLYPDRNAYMGTDERGPDAVPKLHFPGLSADGARTVGRAQDLGRRH